MSGVLIHPSWNYVNSPLLGADLGRHPRRTISTLPRRQRLASHSSLWRLVLRADRPFVALPAIVLALQPCRYSVNEKTEVFQKGGGGVDRHVDGHLRDH